MLAWQSRAAAAAVVVGLHAAPGAVRSLTWPVRRLPCRLQPWKEELAKEVKELQDEVATELKPSSEGLAPQTAMIGGACVPSGARRGPPVCPLASLTVCPRPARLHLDQQLRTEPALARAWLARFPTACRLPASA